MFDRYKSILLIVPHQDDEILMAAGVIRSAVEKKIPIDIVMVTNGDYGCRDDSVGRTRLLESLKGIQILGLSPEHFHILGYADTGMPACDSFLTHLYEEKEGDRIYPSLRGTCTYGLEEKKEYHMVRFGDHGAYCRNTVKQDLKAVMEEKAAQCIITTSPYDLHGDHSALYRFVCEVLEELQKETGYAPALYTGLVHSNAGDANWPKRDTPLFDCPDRLEEETELRWEEALHVPVGDVALKKEALLAYETALEPGAFDFLMSFIKEEEIFWKMREGEEDGRNEKSHISG